MVKRRSGWPIDCLLWQPHIQVFQLLVCAQHELVVDETRWTVNTYTAETLSRASFIITAEKITHWKSKIQFSIFRDNFYAA